MSLYRPLPAAAAPHGDGALRWTRPAVTASCGDCVPHRLHAVATAPRGVGAAAWQEIERRCAAGQLWLLLLPLALLLSIPLLLQLPLVVILLLLQLPLELPPLLL
jgi:hypothetical protein